MSNEKGQIEWVTALKSRTSQSDKDGQVAFWLSLLLGWAGADRFYLGSTDLGLWKLLTFGGFGFWWFLDVLLLLAGNMRDAEGASVNRPF